ncbi:hypothetical protein OH738_22560 [Streptomyces hirsutus]|uniref:Lipoprotein n=1 Tax=Streptomyces hirsutus TaxID=35620 RepID=A0ABZ1GQ83_9ACTN|nr:hypothetical protein [Streptomyces hirsutus]WSD07309.1 hypothetical protein OIE73_17090 [Streptomyces hirsutus]WTD19271.1 hypothetical protein OH738_22560 [Streptomyces hirsutus]WTD75799.1 hypothetical protein OHB56_18990 [Streptomyces sp. NBC_01635]
MMNRHLRKAVVATAVITAGLLMTACQNDDVEDGASGTGGTGVEASASGNAKGVSGSFKNGEVTYLAPGKYIVSVPGKDDQQFFVADDTEVYGVGTICGEAGAKVDAPCTLDQLEAAAKKDAVGADVEMKNGVATLVTERRAAQQGADSGSDSDSGSGSGSDSGSDSGSGETVVEGIDKGKGVNGTWFGNVSYLAPGKYTVSDTKGVEQAFFVSEETEIWGAGDICGDAAGQSATECTEAELEEAAKKGVGAEVTISNGIATRITEDH